MREAEIRAIALGVFQKDSKILVFEGFDPIKNQYFYRPLGGGIEFGEYSQNASIREMREELGAEVAELEYIGVLENIFIYNSQTGHEIVFLYGGIFTDPTIYTNGPVQAHEDDGQPIKAMWKSLADFHVTDGNNNSSNSRDNSASPPLPPPLYPSGLLELLESRCV
jgi:8-oxo-dGTP pyrophosphatase MutT (NUDIX family)